MYSRKVEVELEDLEKCEFGVYIDLDNDNIKEFDSVG